MRNKWNIYFKYKYWYFLIQFLPVAATVALGLADIVLKVHKIRHQHYHYFHLSILLIQQQIGKKYIRITSIHIGLVKK